MIDSNKNSKLKKQVDNANDKEEAKKLIAEAGMDLRQTNLNW